MRPSFVDLARLFLEDLGPVRIALLVLLVGLIIACSLGAFVVARFGPIRWAAAGDRREREAGLARLRLWPRTAVRIGLVAIAIGILAQVVTHMDVFWTIGRYGYNTTPADIAEAEIRTCLTPAAAFLLGVLGLLLGWTLRSVAEWRWIRALEAAAEAEPADGEPGAD